jgi:tRNA (guanosine-2'-O-)-methyltransferase
MKLLISKKRYNKIVSVLQRRQADVCLIMENIQKGHNYSAILRSCDAVGVLNSWAVAYNHVAEYEIQSGISKGAGKWMQLQQIPTMEQAISKAKAQGMQVLAAHYTKDAIDYRDIDYTKPTALVMGQEGWGISDQTATMVDQNIIIPMVGMTESLNVSVASAIILYELQRQRQEAGKYNTISLNNALYKKLLFEFCFPKVADIYKSEGTPYPSTFEDQIIFKASNDKNADGRDAAAKAGRAKQ